MNAFGDITIISFLVLYLGIYYGTSAIEDFTCVTKPRIDIDNEDTYIAGYLLGSNGSVSFARTTYTRTGSDTPPLRLHVPTGYTLRTLETTQENETISILGLPAAGRKTRIGTFACKVTRFGGNEFSIGTTIMSKAADFLPNPPTRTVIKGDDVRLEVTATDPSRTRARWRKNGTDTLNAWKDLLYLNISSASQSQAAYYEIHFAGDRASGKQALMRLIVIDCQEYKWNAPSCDRDCPVCFNGGICEVASGVCICSPGFSGDFCEILLGPDRFGQDGSFHCNFDDELPSTACEGKLFCLPDPFGCTCAAGYQGIDCDTDCPDGSFGAGCSQTCHCMDGACDRTTGRCPGNCTTGFKGINCQDSCPPSMGGLAGNCSTPCTVPAAVARLRDVTPLNSSATQIHLSWKFVSNRCAVERYRVRYQLTNRGQCLDVSQEPVEATPDNYYADSLIISSNLKPYSSYTVYIKAWNEIGYGPEASIDIRTGESVPALAPVVRSPILSGESVTFHWESIPCPSRGGNITGYTYELQDATGTVLRNVSVPTEIAVVNGLTPCTLYSFRVRAQTSVGPGPWMNTSVVVPGMVNMLTVMRTSVPTEIRVTWQEPVNNSCDVEYSIEYALINRGLCAEVTNPVKQQWPAGSPSPLTITGLHPHSIYRVYVTPSNSAGAGMEASAAVMTQGTAPSGSPSNIIVTDVTMDTLSFSWDLPECGHRNGNITHYLYNLTNGASGENLGEDTVETSVDFTGLASFVEYTLTVSAVNSFGSGPVATIIGRTGTPSKPLSLMATLIEETSIRLEWRPPLFPIGSMFKYVIVHRVIARPYDSSFTFDSNSKFQSQEIDMSVVSGTVNDLEPSTKYEIQVYIVTDAGIEGDKAAVELFTALATDLPPPEKPTLRGDDSQSASLSVTISLVGVTTSKYVTSYQVGVKNTNIAMATSRRSERSSPQFWHYSENPSSYVAAELPRRLPDEFVVGDNKIYGGYFNPSLQKGAAYEIYIGAVSRTNDTEASVVWNEDPLEIEVAGGSSPGQGSDNTGIAVGIALTILAAVAVVLGAVVIWKRCQQLARKENGRLQTTSAASQFTMAVVNGEEECIHPPASLRTSSPARSQIKPQGIVSPKKEKQVYSVEDPIALDSLADFIKSKKTMNGFQQDYESLPDGPLYPWTVARKEQNTKKNRYTNIVTYDHSRVVLECTEEDPHSDYINASYIHGYKQASKYIACQGPNRASVVDIWRMVWQERVGILVMLTNLVENGKVKCEKYWPESVQMYYDLSVTKVNEKSYTNYIVRTFHLSKCSDPEGEYRELIQYHYTTWPDMKLPESSSLLQFVRRVQVSETSEPGPVVVHCSAGVGRTGTFIALDSMLSQAQAEGQIDVFNFVRAMREQRIRMVQTLDQYKFIFDGLLESCLAENTAIPVAELQQDYAKLKKRDCKKGTSGIEDQFNMLETFTVIYSEDKCRGGRESVNLDKNRFHDCIPADKSRPYLMTPGEDCSTNYINATFLDGYSEKSAYLTTQAPLPNTLGDIWRMVFDYKSSCIVMLNSMDNDPNVPQYWPDEGSMVFGSLTVTFQGIHIQNDVIIVRHFGIHKTDEKKVEQIVCHIQYLGWPSWKEIPNSPASLLKVLETVQMWTNDHPDGPITVHCIDGLGRSGTLCALMTVLDSVRQEQVLDAFQAVKKLRATRAGMVQTLAQYQLCYQVTQNYLDCNCIYENLR